MTELSKVRVSGPLAGHAEGFCAELVRRGYAPRAARDHVYVLAHLGRWLVKEGVEPPELTAQTVKRYLRARQRAGYRRWVSVRSLQPLLGYLEQSGVVPACAPPAAEGPVEQVLVAYRHYLLVERRLASATVRLHEDIARRFLAQRVMGGVLDLDGLSSLDVTAFVLGEARLRRIGSMKALVSPLRSLLRFLFMCGSVPWDLSAAVPGVASPQLVSLPKGVDAATVAALLGSCDRATAVGRRDFAMYGATRTMLRPALGSPAAAERFA